MAKREIPEINASSLADIAFLLLTFFLVATTLNKPIGMYEKLPDLEKVKEDTKELESIPKNILTISIDDNNVLKIRGKEVSISDVKKEVMSHIDNNGNGKCSYCDGEKDPEYSEEPAKAYVLLSRTNQSNYKTKYAVVAAVESAYSTLRDKYAQATYKKNYKSIKDYYKKSITMKDPDLEMVGMYKDIENKYPSNFSKPNPQDKL